jgi:hypothetical protein
MTRDDARLAEMRHIGARARALAEAQDAAEIGGPRVEAVEQPSGGVFVVLFAGLAVSLGALAWGVFLS